MNIENARIDIERENLLIATIGSGQDSNDEGHNKSTGTNDR